ncbi:hypothetical protein ACU62R_13145, partial [Klebsiella aerogenes]
FITVSVGMVQAIICHRQNMKTSIINGSEVSRLSVAIHYERKTLDMIADHIPETKKKVAEIERHTTSKFIKDLASDMAFKDLQRANAYWYEKAVELGYKEEE